MRRLEGPPDFQCFAEGSVDPSLKGFGRVFDNEIRLDRTAFDVFPLPVSRLDSSGGGLAAHVPNNTASTFASGLRGPEKEKVKMENAEESGLPQFVEMKSRIRKEYGKCRDRRGDRFVSVLF